MSYGYPNRTKKVTNSYEEAIEIAKKRDYLLSEKHMTIDEMHELNFKLETFYETFSEADEYDTSYEDLQNEYEEAKLKLDYLEKEIKKIEK